MMEFSNDVHFQIVIEFWGVLILPLRGGNMQNMKGRVYLGLGTCGFWNLFATKICESNPVSIFQLPWPWASNRPGPSAFSSVARQMGHHGAWPAALQLLPLLRNQPGSVKLELWCAIAWAMDVARPCFC